VSQDRICTLYMTVYLVISLPKIPYIHRIYMVLANPWSMRYAVQQVLVWQEEAPIFIQEHPTLHSALCCFLARGGTYLYTRAPYFALCTLLLFWQEEARDAVYATSSVYLSIKVLHNNALLGTL